MEFNSVIANLIGKEEEHEPSPVRVHDDKYSTSMGFSVLLCGIKGSNITKRILMG